MAEHARTALDDFRPEVIKLKWKEILLNTQPRKIGGLAADQESQKTTKGYGGYGD
jgi:hypothetical protein